MNRIEQLTARAYEVPTDHPEADGTAAWTSTTMVVVHARCGDVVGTGWTYGPAACADVVERILAPLLRGRRAVDVNGCWSTMVAAVRNATRAGVAGYAISAVDVALWDLKARLLDLPLVDLLGRVHEAVPIYGSGGFTTYDDERTAAQLLSWTRDQRIGRVKIKVGESAGTEVQRDVHRIRLARDVVGEGVELFVDANGAYTAKQAVRVMREVDDCDVVWLEEPVSSDDLAGLATVRSLVTADVAAGEYGSDLTYFRRMCAAGAVDCLQVDATRAGGCTEWLRAGAVAHAHGLEVSAHCAPNLHAALGCATPNLRHLEWFHDHARIEALLLDGALDPAGGELRPAADAGHGMSLRTDVAAELRTLTP